MLLTIFLILIIILIIYRYLKSSHQYWQLQHIPYLQPKFIFGNGEDLCLGRKSILEYQCDIYRKSKSTKLLGVYMFYKPTLYITDVTWIDCILHKDFRYFIDRGIKFDFENEPLTRHLFHLEGQEWKSIRNKVMPAFMTDGIKTFLPMLVESASKLQNYLHNTITSERDLDMRDILSRYAADVIGTCAYGIDSGALKHGDTEFYRMSRKIFLPRMRTLLKLILPNLPTFMVECFDIKMVEKTVSEYFRAILHRELQKRRETGEITPNDFLSFMMNLQGIHVSDNTPVTDNLIMAHCFMFFIAGYENASGVLCATLYELADHPEIQHRLFEEIRNHCTTNYNVEQITYENILEMDYLDMVVSEVLRLYPPASGIIRECAQDYEIPGSEFTIKKGTQVVIPICGVHRDSRYYPYADEFNPENFSKEARAKRGRCAYIPFGAGPRICIGKKFGEIQIKVALIFLIYNYTFHPSAKMRRPIKFEKKTFITSIEGGVWVKAELRPKTDSIK